MLRKPPGTVGGYGYMRLEQIIRHGRRASRALTFVGHDRHKGRHNDHWRMSGTFEAVFEGDQALPEDAVDHEARSEVDYCLRNRRTPRQMLRRSDVLLSTHFASRARVPSTQVVGGLLVTDEAFAFDGVTFGRATGEAAICRCDNSRHHAQHQVAEDG